MPDWTRTMQQTYSYYIVDPITWRDIEPISNVKSASITREADSNTKGSASFSFDTSVGECYIRAYLDTIQNGQSERTTLGTYLLQTPSISFDGKVRTESLDAYTPLIELKEKQPPVGFYIPKGENIVDTAIQLIQENCRAPVLSAASSSMLEFDFVSNTDDTMLSFVTDLLANAKFTIDVDPEGRIIFLPIQELSALQPVFVYTDDNSSILYPELDLQHDIFSVPNVVEVIYSNGANSSYAKVVNDNPDNPLSTVSRGREIIYREHNPDVIGTGGTEPEAIIEYATQLLERLNTVEYTVSYTHGYCPVKVGDCVIIDYKKAGIDNVKAQVISQTIGLETGCSVQETAVFTEKLWERTND